MRLNTSKGSTLIGKDYPLYLDNNELTKNYYLVRVVSPSITDRLIPNLSLKPIITKMPTRFSKSEDILNIINERRFEEKTTQLNSVSKLKDLMKRERERSLIKENGIDFPLFEMKQGNSYQKALIVQIRDQIRWRNYRIQPGKFIEVMWTSDKMVLFELKGDQENLWIDPVGIYNLNDVEMTNPMVELLDKFKSTFKPKIYTGKSKITELNTMLKTVELDSFDNNEF